MSFISVFDVLGPNMIGPSSSHTAGAAAIALLAGKMPNAAIKKADFILYGSFARTYKGHGTDRALLGGIMGFSTDDRRIPDSFSIADERGLQYSFTANTTETEIHPNTVDIHMTDENGQKLKSEFYIPLAVNNLIVQNRITCKVLDTPSKWFGVTYAEDRQQVVLKINELIRKGFYPQQLFKK